tara:strand:+ start:249 stop:863 length:615 start_codon:yes stop_codon:yes gene_type:complete
MTENGKVAIVPDEHGSVIRVSKNNPEFGHVRLTQEKVAFGAQGWVNKKTRSTLIHGTVEDLQSIGIADKTELPGHIVIREQFEAFSTDNPDRDLKIAGDTGIVCIGTNTETGEMDAPIYRKTFYSMDLNEQDTLIAHTNSDAIRAANGNESKKVTITKDQLDEMTSNDEEEKPKSTRRNKKEETEDLEETPTEEVEVEDSSFEL